MSVSKKFLQEIDVLPEGYRCVNNWYFIICAFDIDLSNIISR